MKRKRKASKWWIRLLSALLLWIAAYPVIYTLVATLEWRMWLGWQNVFGLAFVTAILVAFGIHGEPKQKRTRNPAPLSWYLRDGEVHHRDDDPDDPEDDWPESLEGLD